MVSSKAWSRTTCNLHGRINRKGEVMKPSIQIYRIEKNGVCEISGKKGPIAVASFTNGSFRVVKMSMNVLMNMGLKQQESEGGGNADGKASKPAAPALAG